MRAHGARFQVALIDASRDNPDERKFRDQPLGLAALTPPPDALVMYAQRPNSAIKDDGAATSVFASEVIRQIGRPNLSAETALLLAREAILGASHGNEAPWIAIATQDAFTFNSAAHIASLSAPTLPADKTAVAESSEPPARAVDMTCRIEEPTVDELARDPRIKSASDALALRPDDRDARNRRAQLYGFKGAYGAALTDFNALIAQGQRDAETYNDRCFVRTVLGDLPAALADCDAAVRQKPNLANARDSRGLARLKNGAFAAAIEDFDVALRLDPKLASTLYARGIAKQRSGLAAEGEADLRAAMNIDSLAGNEVASYGIADPHPEWGLRGVVHFSGDNVVIADGDEMPDGSIADSRTTYTPGDPRFAEVVRHLCGLKAGEQKLFRPWHMQ